MLNTEVSRLNIEFFKKLKTVFILALLLFVINSFLATIAYAASFPSLKVEPVSIEFGAIMVGSSSQAEIVTITNEVDSTNVLTIYNIYIYGPDADSFTIKNDDSSGKILDGSLSSTLEVLFKPVSAGKKDAMLMIPSNASDKSYELALSGIGFASNNDQTSETTDNETETTSSTNQTSKPGEDNSSTNWPVVIITVSVIVLMIVAVFIARMLSRK